MMRFDNVAFAGMGLGAWLWALYYIARALGARRWPTVQGEVAQTRLVRRNGPGDEPGPDYEYVAYRYEVAGQPYRNDRVRFGPVVAPSDTPSLDPAPGGADADALAGRFPERAPVRVHYNPRDPSDSVLFPVPAWQVWPALALGAVFLYYGVTRMLGLR